MMNTGKMTPTICRPRGFIISHSTSDPAMNMKVQLSATGTALALQQSTMCFAAWKRAAAYAICHGSSCTRRQQ
jgi:hypothetical protein